MPTLTTKAKYKNGVVIPEIKPSYPPEEVVVTFVEPKDSFKLIKSRILAIIKKTFGIWGKGASGVQYENKIRSEAEKHFENL